MPRALLLSMRFNDGRYHGTDASGRPEWPPSPARLFQALVAGAAQGRSLAEKDADALRWLEILSGASAPIIAAPSLLVTRGFANYVPNNNDMAIKNGTLKRIGKEKTDKLVKPLLFDACVPLLYAWQFEPGEAHEKHAKAICAMAERLYQLGRGVDMAWAWGEIIEAEELEERLGKHGGAIYRPARSGQGRVLLCPQKGSLESLCKRFEEIGQRFRTIKTGQQVQQIFSQARKPRFAVVAYDSPPWRFLFELRATADTSSLSPWPLVETLQLVESIRDRAAHRLMKALPDKAAIIERVFIGRNATEADKAARIRILPLPSIGSPHVARAIRRILIEMPPNCCLAAEDIGWAFSGLDLNFDYETGEISGGTKPILIAADDDSMLRHYGLDEGSAGHRVWRTVTPAALPEQAARRRIDPRRLREELAAARDNPAIEVKAAKPGRERLQEEACAVTAVAHALRHAKVETRLETIRVQREPFERRSARAEAFAPGTRFAKERLWHIEIAFAEPQRGPLAIGDGRYLGLGLMAPLREAARDALVFAVPREVKITVADTPVLVRAVRRALMALERDVTGKVTKLFSGHEGNGAPAASGSHEHVFLAADDSDGDGLVDRLIVAAPWVCDRRLGRSNRDSRANFDEVVSNLRVVRAGHLGVVTFDRPLAFAEQDDLVGPARVWQSRTPYLTTRHAGRRKNPAEAVMRDLVLECLRRGLPRPEVEITDTSGIPNGGGLSARARLRFTAAVSGPLLLGRDSHRGGGLFVALD